MRHGPNRPGEEVAPMRAPDDFKRRNEQLARY